MIILDEQEKKAIRTLANDCVDRDGEWMYEYEDDLFEYITDLLNKAKKK